MTDSIKISVIVPAYNNAPWLPRCLDSLLAQTHHNLEIIIVDDGSTDNTMEVLRHYQNKDSRIISIHQDNGGVTSARLHGVSAASGEWVGFVDGDDWVEPQMFEHLLKNAVEYQADISHCGVQRNFPDGRVDYYYNTGEILNQNREQGLQELLLGSKIEPGLVCKLFRRNLFDGLAGWIDQSVQINEDLLMNYYLFRHTNQSIFDDFCPYHYVMRQGSASSLQWNSHKLEDPIRVTKLMMAENEDCVTDILFQKYIRQLIFGATRSLSNQPELIRPHRAMMRKELRSQLKDALFGRIGSKLKLMTLWAAVWPKSYSAVHIVYAHISGVDKKYSV